MGRHEVAAVPGELAVAGRTLAPEKEKTALEVWLAQPGKYSVRAVEAAVTRFRFVFAARCVLPSLPPH